MRLTIVISLTLSLPNNSGSLKGHVFVFCGNEIIFGGNELIAGERLCISSENNGFLKETKQHFDKNLLLQGNKQWFQYTLFVSSFRSSAPCGLLKTIHYFNINQD